MKLVTVRYGQYNLIMLEALMKSVAVNMPGTKLTILSDRQTPKHPPTWNTELFELVEYDVDDYRPFVPKVALLNRYVQEAPEEEEICYLDSDCLLLKPIETLPEWSIFACTPRPGPFKYNTGYLQFKAVEAVRGFFSDWYEATCRWGDRPDEARRKEGGVDQASLVEVMARYELRQDFFGRNWKEYNLCQNYEQNYETALCRVLHLKGSTHAVLLSGKTENLPAPVKTAWEAYRPKRRWEEIKRRLPEGRTLYGVEIGVWKGLTSMHLLRSENVSLWMIDAWEAQEPDGTYLQSGDRIAALSQETFDNAYRSALQSTEFAKDRRTVIRMRSDEAARFLRVPYFFDFVFIDGDHSYEGCKRDIEAWYQRVKAGGLLCGHDYAHHEFPGFGVTEAVDEFAKINQYDVDLGDDHTWFIHI